MVVLSRVKKHNVHRPTDTFDHRKTQRKTQWNVHGLDLRICEVGINERHYVSPNRPSTQV
uniref:Uncharacterized protein n=1 Tax=Picea glauca TaxID=3330 RepID=A0A101LXH2_PICGL|nr:hypothetical protein ABT39_MTgene6163 [Picea glauca]QHR88780.1 hypothetical protein Q903MT_gene2795 [Picea sitchensis]